MATIMHSTKDLTATQLIELLGRLEAFKRQFTDYWIANQFDAVISPAGILPAVPNKYTSELYSLNSHFMLYNILDYPSGTVPVKLVQHEDLKDVEAEEAGFIPIRKRQSTRPADRLDEFIRLAQLDSQGLPVGIQVSTLPNKDEMCLHVMEVIERAMNFNDLGSLLY